jgi:hypothetical protein
LKEEWEGGEREEEGEGRREGGRREEKGREGSNKWRHDI